MVKGIGVPDFHLENIKNLQIPLPPLSIQQELAGKMDRAYKLKTHKEFEAKELLDSIDGYVMEELGIKIEAKNERKNFSFLSNQITKNFSPEYNIAIKSRLRSKFELFALKELCLMYQSKTISKMDMKDEGDYVVFGANGIIGKYDKYNHEEQEVLVTCRGATCGEVNISEPKSWITGNAMVIKPLKDSLQKEFLAVALRSLNLSEVITGSAQPQITKENLQSFAFPLPPLSIQQSIAAEVMSRRAKAKILQTEAIEILEKAKQEFEVGIL